MSGSVLPAEVFHTETANMWPLVEHDETSASKDYFKVLTEFTRAIPVIHPKTGNMYRVVGMASFTKDNDLYVLYKPTYVTSPLIQLCARPSWMFYERIGDRYRFEVIHEVSGDGTTTAKQQVYNHEMTVNMSLTKEERDSDAYHKAATVINSACLGDHHRFGDKPAEHGSGKVTLPRYITFSMGPGNLAIAALLQAGYTIIPPEK